MPRARSLRSEHHERGRRMCPRIHWCSLRHVQKEIHEIDAGGWQVHRVSARRTDGRTVALDRVRGHCHLRARVLVVERPAGVAQSFAEAASRQEHAARCAVQNSDRLLSR